MDDVSNKQTAEQSDVEESITAAVKKGSKKGGKEQTEVITIPALKIAVVTFSIKGTTPLISHNFGQKERRKMLETQMGTKQVHKKREPKDPTMDFLGSLYPLEGTPTAYKDGEETKAKGKFGFPANAVKLACISACRQLDGVFMTRTLGMFHVLEYLIPILNAETGKPAHPRMVEDIVRLPNGSADLRYRGYFDNWMMKVAVQYNTSVISPTQIANLLNTAGFAVGLGDWRPEKRGNCGMFTVDSNA